MTAGWYVTAPCDQVSVRHGDPLGFRASADYLADLLALGLSNGTSDARWISILSWYMDPEVPEVIALDTTLLVRVLVVESPTPNTNSTPPLGGF